MRKILEISAIAKMQITTGYISGSHISHLHNETSLTLFLLIATLLSINLTILYLEIILRTDSFSYQVFLISPDKDHSLYFIFVFMIS